MVTVTNYLQKESAEGKKFIALELTGDIEVAISEKSGRMYATARKCTIASSFDENVCKSLMGKQLPGTIKKVEVDEPYDYKVPGTKDVIQLNYRFEYSASELETNLEEAVFN